MQEKHHKSVAPAPRYFLFVEFFAQPPFFTFALSLIFAIVAHSECAQVLGI